MASQSIKYVPKNQRQGGKRRRPERFHGAFTGGFSAGHFNTVGTEEGWQPRANIEEGQKMEDYMDEQDHNEWGGPQGVRRDFQGRHLSTKPEQVGTGSHLEQMLFGSQELIPSNIGSRLLRKLGWKEGSSYAFVRADGASATQEQQSPREDELNARVLSNRRIRKIRIQQTNMKIPSPKLDTVGLGFEAHKDAPEFAAFLAQRKRKAQERAQGNHRSVYRLSTVLGDTKAGQVTEHSSRLKIDHNYESYEVVEDFVGTRTVGGFALRDDEDDAFDDHAGHSLTKVSDKVVLDKDKYNTVIEDPVSDDDGEDLTRRSSDVQDLSAGFSAFTDAFGDGQASESRKSTTRALTSDGRPPLSGFVLGGGGDSVTTRFRGPDVPTDFEAKLHVFRDDEHPLVWKALTRAVQLENEDARKEAAMRGALASRRVHKKATEPQKTSTPLAGSAFASLASSMKDRFTSSSVGTGEANTQSALPAGLISSDAIPKAPSQLSRPVEKHRNLSVSQTTQSFSPAPLLCKRFGVRAPTLSSTALVTKDGSIVSQEESFFVDKVLAAAKAGKPSPSAPEKADEIGQGTDILANRPPMAVYESIFGGNEEEGEVDSEEEQNEAEAEQLLPSARHPVPPESTRETAEHPRSSHNKAAAAAAHHHSDGSFSSDVSEKGRKASKRSSEHRKRRKKEKKKKEKRKRRKRERRDSHDSGSTKDSSRHGDRTSTQKDSKRSKKVRKNH